MRNSTIFGFVLPILLMAAEPAPGNENGINGDWQLFIDDHCVQEKSEVIRTLHQPVKYEGNPILKGNGLWDNNPYLYGSVIYDREDSVYKMWYMSYNHGLPLTERTPFLYATSIDGIHWDRPNLGLFDFRGSKENNIILINYGHHDQYCPSVIKDIHDADPNRRYKMVYWDYPLGSETYGHAGMCLAVSPDGIHWNRHAGNPVHHAMKKERSISDVMDLMYDSRSRNYVAYAKGWAEPFPRYRQIVRTSSSDFIHWSEPEVVLGHAFDESDPQSYGMPVSQYESLYVGILRSYKKPGNETIDTQLAISHDNRSWARAANQETFLPLGPSESWDSGMIFTAPPIVRDGRIDIYYGGWDGPHDATNRNAAIGLASLRKDGFVSLDAGIKPGSVTTIPMKTAQGRLRLNAEIKKEGWIRAELLDLEGRVLEGYERSQCIALQSGGIDQRISWRTKSVLPDEAPIRIRFVFSQASLYSFHAGQVEFETH